MTSITTEHTIETQEKWEPIDGIVAPAASALIAEDQEGLIVTLFFSEVVNGCDSDLHLKFGRVLAFGVYEELLHPWDTLEAAPRLTGQWDKYIYPLLQIRNSKWMVSLPNFLFVHPNAMHYRLLTLDKIIDVLCSNPPEVTWVTGRALTR